MTTRQAILAAISDTPGLTEDELRTDPRVAVVPPNGIRPGRMRLWLAGLIEPDSDAAWDDALANRVKDVRWRAVVDPEQQKVVSTRAAKRKSRIATSPEARARRIVDDMGDATIRRLVETMMAAGAPSAKTQRGLDQTLRKKHQERVQQARRAARDKTADADFKRMLRELWDARGAVAAVDSHLIQERARVANGERRRIADGDWVTALDDVRTIITSFGSMWKNVRDLRDPDEPCPACGAAQVGEERHLQAFALDGSAVEVESSDVAVVDVGPEIVDAEVVSA
jgi:hypothetical protein